MGKNAETLAQAHQLHRAGDFDRAEQLYRQVAEADPDQAEAWCYLGDIALRRGCLAEAVTSYERAVQLRPDYPVAHHDLGVAFANQGKSEQAAACFRQALQCRPDYAEAHFNLGTLLFNQGKLLQALRCVQQALRLRPDYAEAHHHLGMVRAALGQLPEALASQQQALAIRPGFPAAERVFREVLATQQWLYQEMVNQSMSHGYMADSAAGYSELGLALQSQGKLTEAVAAFQEAIRVRPDFAEVYNNLGLAFKDRDNPEEAIASLRKALELKPDFVAAQHNLGLALDKAGRFEEAVACFERALQLDPGSADAYNSWGCVLQEQDRLEEAVARYRTALRLNPNLTQAHSNLGEALHELGKYDEALAHFDEAARQDPQSSLVHFNRAMLRLLRGDFKQGWPEYEARFQTWEFAKRSFPSRRWDGSRVAGQAILLYPEQGLGDTLQFVRYAPLVRERCGAVLVQCQASLVTLLARTPGIDKVLPLGAPWPEFAASAPLLSLPGLFGTELANVPATIPYLFADDGLVERWRSALEKFGPGFRIGIAWQGNPNHRNDRRRSVPLQHFAPLDERQGVRLFSLQVGPGIEQLPGVGQHLNVIDLGGRFDPATLADAAAVLKCLDLLVTVDSALAHLAGGLGVPAWVVLPYVPDWRWLQHREDSPWYPTLRLFRQCEPDNWQSVIERIGRELDKLLAV